MVLRMADPASASPLEMPGKGRLFEGGSFGKAPIVSPISFNQERLPRKGVCGGGSSKKDGNKETPGPTDMKVVSCCSTRDSEKGSGHGRVSQGCLDVTRGPCLALD